MHRQGYATAPNRDPVSLGNAAKVQLHSAAGPGLGAGGITDLADRVKSAAHTPAGLHSGPLLPQPAAAATIAYVPPQLQPSMDIFGGGTGLPLMSAAAPRAATSMGTGLDSVFASPPASAAGLGAPSNILNPLDDGPATTQPPSVFLPAPQKLMQPQGPSGMGGGIGGMMGGMGGGALSAAGAVRPKPDLSEFDSVFK